MVRNGWYRWHIIERVSLFPSLSTPATRTTMKRLLLHALTGLQPAGTSHNKKPSLFRASFSFRSTLLTKAARGRLFMTQPMSSRCKRGHFTEVSSNRGQKHRKVVYIVDWQTEYFFVSFSLTSPSSSNTIFVFNFTFLLSSFLAAATFVFCFLAFNSFSSVFSWKKKLWFVCKAWEVSCLAHLQIVIDPVQKWLLEYYSVVEIKLA